MVAALHPVLEMKLGPMVPVKVKETGVQDRHRETTALPSRTVEFELLAAPGHLIRRAQQVHTELWSKLVTANLTSVQFAVLVVLDSTPGIDQRTLGERVSLDNSTVAELCRRLTARGLISRERDLDDARRNVLALTLKARRLLRDVTPSVEEVGKQLLGKFSGRERAELMRLLGRLVDPPRPYSLVDRSSSRRGSR